MRLSFLCLGLTALWVAFAGAGHARTSAGALFPIGLQQGQQARIVVPASSHDHAAVTAGELEITAFWVREMLPNQPAAGGYLTITSKGGGDRLLSASSPSSARVEIHRMEMANEVMVMRPVEGGLEIPPGGTVELKPGGLHLMFISPIGRFREGDSIPVSLRFERAGEVEVHLPVRPADGHSGH